MFQSQHDYMDEWLPRRVRYLRAITLRDHLPDSTCSQCSAASGYWRCEDCLGGLAVCRECCRLIHGKLPFHRIQYWVGTHYERDWLCNLGVVIHLGHRGLPCPLRTDPVIVTESKHQEKKKRQVAVDVYASPSGLFSKPSDSVAFTVGNTNGIHKVWVRHCGCQLEEEEYQLLELGLYPLSHQRIQSAFTFDLLDTLRLDNLECKTSVYHLSQKLRRLTCPLFPHAVPNRYQELYRVGRQWRNMKHRKQSGWIYADGEPGGPGSLALFCPACPQPGINVPHNWQSDPELTAYSRSFVMDGNFSAVHQKRLNAVPEKCLTDGHLYLVSDRNYLPYLASAKEFKEVATCNEHHAVNDKFIVRRSQDVTGVGATACARHGAFCPSGVVNFQRGERQQNMDYSLCHGIANSNVGDIDRVILYYDVVCQYCVNLLRRVKDAKKDLPLPDQKTIYYGIGAFHISGHIPRCFPRHSPHFIPGAGVVDGEILETLWSVLNEVSPSAQTASLGARTELLDDHMLDSNWKKLINIVTTVLKKSKRAVQGLEESDAYLRELSVNIDIPTREKWDEQMSNAQMNRATNIEAMDVFDVAFEKDPTCAQKQLELMKDETKHCLEGCTAWLADGLDLQQSQLVLTAEHRSAKKQPSQEDALIFERKRQALNTRIEKHRDRAERYLPPQVVNHIPGHGLNDDDNHWVDTNWEVDEEETAIDLEQLTVSDSDDLVPEKRAIFLPSTIGYDGCKSTGLQDLMKMELSIRQGEASDALQAIRLGIGEKSFRFRNHLRTTTSKVQKTRSWDAIHAVDKRLKLNCLIYRQARLAMVRLGAPKIILDRYKLLTSDDLHTNTAVQEPNARGQRNEELSWIWRIPGLSVTSQDTLLHELYRVSWIRARSRHERWQEELSISHHEMVWVPLWFQHRAQEWNDRAMKQGGGGLAAYAYRQAANWNRMKQVALSRFQEVNPQMDKIFGYHAINKL